MHLHKQISTDLKISFVSLLTLVLGEPDARAENRQQLCLKTSECSYQLMSSVAERYTLQR